MLDYSFLSATVYYVLGALPMTMFLTFIPAALGFVFGIILCLIRLKKIPVLSGVVSLFYSFFRSCPLIVLIFLSYYGIPKLLNYMFYGGIRRISVVNISNVAVALLTMSLYSSAFMGEIMRGAITSVDRGQYDGAYSLGLGEGVTFRYIILPQALRIAVPNICNFCIGLMKGSSVVFAIGVIDMMAAAKLQAETGYRYIEAYLLVGIMYVILTFIIQALFRGFENRLSRGYLM